MIRKLLHGRELPAEILDDERSWQGDHDPYLGGLAHEGRKHREAPPPRSQRLAGPADDGDSYLAELVHHRPPEADGA